MTALNEQAQYWDGYAERLSAVDAEWGSLEFFRQVKAGHDEAFGFSNSLVDLTTLRGKSALSICCGVGLDALEFAKHGAEVSFLSPSPKINDLTRKYFDYYDLTASYELSGAEALPYQDASFDFVDARSILMYTPSPEGVVEEIRRVLKPGGQVLAHLYNKYSWYAVLAKLSGEPLIQVSGDPPFSRLHRAGDAKQLFRNYSSTEIFLDRFPFRTENRGGITASLYNNLFVPITKALPRALIRPFGFYIIVKAVK